MTIPPDRSDAIFASQPIKPGQSIAGSMQEAARGGVKPFTMPQSPAQVPGAALATAPTAAPSLDTLIAQVGTSQEGMGNLRNQLSTKNLTLKRSQQHLLRNKLSDASLHLRAASERLGVPPSPMPTSTGSRPIERFLSYVTDGENQLAGAKARLGQMQKRGEQIRPTDLMLMQVKLTQAQQEIEYCSVLLGKVIDAIKSTLNVAL